MQSATTPAHPLPGRLSPRVLLFLVSVLGLFLEMVLIRWVGTEIRIFAYLQNTVLIACFLGLGMGCLTCRRPAPLRALLLPLTLLVGLLAIPWTRAALGQVSEMLSVFGGVLIWTDVLIHSDVQQYLLPALGLALTALLVGLLWSIFVPVGRWMGRLIEDDPNTIAAYSINVAGSLLGIWLFVLLSAFDQPPLTWLAVVALLAAPLIGRARVALGWEGGLLLGVVALAWWAGQDAGALEVRWSPYQKLVLREGDPKLTGPGERVISVNNTFYQFLFDFSDASTRAQPRRFPEEIRALTQYDFPALLHPRPRRGLIVGAGSGNDAAGMLRHGVEEVVAVEIDPTIIDLGRRFHPEKPYSSPHVRVVNDDARSYFATTHDRFDLIVFGLLDSHTTTAMTNARLDHYVYTRESLTRARSLLADGGVMVLSFAAQRPFIADRIGGMLREEFAQEPLCFAVPHRTNLGGGGVVFVVGDLEAVRSQLDRNPRLAALVARYQRDEPVSLPGTAPHITDDWPYLYLEMPHVPALYFALAGLLLMLLVVFARWLHLPGLMWGWQGGAWHFFFLGAAFLLLEVQNISKAAVVLGNTWEVNAVIVSGVLVMILLANGLAARFPRLPLGPVYVLLCGSCVGLYFLDLSRFGFLPYAAKAVVVGLLTSVPMLFSGLVFIRSFARTPLKDMALGANLFGALFGGLLQSVTFVTGIKALLLLVAALYAAAFLTRPRR